MKKKISIIAFSVLILIVVSYFIVNLYINNVLIGEWKLTSDNYIMIYTFKEDGSLTYYVKRPDNTEDIYEYGKYKISWFKISYVNPNYENGFGTEKNYLKYDIFKKSVYESENNLKGRKFSK